MTYGGIQMFMEKLNQLINCNNIPFFNHPEIKRERPQFQLLYDELGSMIQTLFIDQHQDLYDLEKVTDVKQRFIYAAEETEYNVDLFLSEYFKRSVHIRKNGHFPTCEYFKRSLKLDDVRRSFKSLVNLFLSCVHIRNNEHDSPTSGHFKLSLNLDDVRRSFKSVEVEFMSMIMDGMKAGSSRRSERTLNQFAPAPIPFSRNLLGSKKLMDEVYVGIDRDAELIRDKLVEDQKKLDVVSIVGMGGIGKTTLATKVYNDGYVKHHFYVRVWVTVSQTYDKRAVLTQILKSIRAQLNRDSAIHEKGNKHEDLEKATDSELRERVHKDLMGQRYLIVIDDIWDIETWDNLKVFFPHDNTGSRILLTSRLTEVAKHAKSDGLIHHLGYLNKKTSWELLCQKVFQGNECPEWSMKPGMQIVENCQGLPLAVVVIAGVLAKETWSEEFWVEIAKKTGSYIVGDKNGCMETLGLSYHHLPLHLRECFLYLGGFPEDHMFQVQRLILLWVAEGFIEQDGNRSLEDIARSYLMDLIDRNLLIVADMSEYDGVVKACKVHDLVRELCLRKAMEERFVLMAERKILSAQFPDIITRPYKPVRMFINKDMNILGFPYSHAQNLRSIVCFSEFHSLSDVIANGFPSFVLLRVLDLQDCRLDDFPCGIELLVNLRYLAIFNESLGFPSSICKLWNLQTLVYITYCTGIVLPSNISDLVNLRHLWLCHPCNRISRGVYWISSKGVDWISKGVFKLPSIERPMKNLQTISGVKLGDGVDNFQKCFPYIKKLTCITASDKQNDFKTFTYLEKLNLTSKNLRRVKSITFPATLKTLALKWCHLGWSEMSIIQSLPNLQVLKLKKLAFEGSCWNTDGQEFPQLKFLRLDSLNIKQWKANSGSFPCLRQLEIICGYDLEEIPLETGDIPALELIKIRKCRRSVGESVRRIEEEQRHFGNYDLKIDIQDE